LVAEWVVLSQPKVRVPGQPERKAKTREQEETLERLDEVPDVGRRGAEEILAEIAKNGPPASWAKVCPGSGQPPEREEADQRQYQAWEQMAGGATLVEAAQYHRLAALGDMDTGPPTDSATTVATIDANGRTQAVMDQ
jgi:hypothetical protein